MTHQETGKPQEHQLSGGWSRIALLTGSLALLSSLATPTSAQDAEPGAEPSPDELAGAPPTDSASEVAQPAPEIVETIPVSSLQEPEAESPPEQAAPRALQEIIVTAQKREQSLQDVPISVSSFSDDFLKDKAIVDIGEVSKYTPNVRFNDSNASSPILTIRGLGTPPSATGVEPSVGLVVDDVSYARTSYLNDAVFDLKRLEILRGPQGSLFGKNTLAGVMNMTTADPDFDGTGYVAGGLGSFDERRIEAAQSFALVDDVLAARVALRYRDRDIGLYNTARDEEDHVKDMAGRVKLKWFASDDADLLLNAWASEQDTTGIPWQLCDATERSVNVMRRYDPEAEADCYNDTTSVDAESKARRTTTSASLRYNQALGELGLSRDSNFTSVISWSKIELPYQSDVDFSPIRFLEYGSSVPDHYDQKQLELRFSGNTPGPFGWGDDLDFLVGAFAGKHESTTSAFLTAHYEGLTGVYDAGAPPIPGGPSTPDSNGTGVNLGITDPVILALLDASGGGASGETYFTLTEARGRSLAFFSQFDWHLNAELTATLGLRYGSDTRKGSVASGPEQPARLFEPLLGLEEFDTALKDSDRDFSPKATLSWALDPSVTVFGTVAKGFKSGGFAAAVFKNRNLKFEPETSVSYEVGIKSHWFDETLSLNASAFHTTIDDLQVRTFDGRTFQVSNAGGAEASGIEMDFLWVPPLPWLTIGGSAGFTRAEYTDYHCGPGEATAQPGSGPADCQTGEVSTNQPAYRDFSGEPLPFAPESSASLFISTDVSFGSNWHFVSGLDVLHQGEAVVGEGRVFTQPATTKLAARLGIKSDTGLNLILSARNLTSEEELVWGLDQPTLPGNHAGISVATEPTWQLDLRYDWGV